MKSILTCFLTLTTIVFGYYFNHYLIEIDE